MNDYLAAGRPLVATSVGDVANLIRDEQAGVVTKPLVEEFALGIEMLLENMDLRIKYGRKARMLAETKLSWSFVTEQLENFYSRFV